MSNKTHFFHQEKLQDLSDKSHDWLISTLHRKEQELTAIIEGSRAIFGKTDFPSTARAIFDQCCKLIGATSGYVALLSEDGEENEVLFLEDGGMKCTVDPELPMPIRGLRAEAYKGNCAAYHNDFMNSEWVEMMPHGHMALKNVIFAPLVLNEKTVGIMGMANKASDFTTHDSEIAVIFGELAAIALENSRYLEKGYQAQKELPQTIKNLETAQRIGHIGSWEIDLVNGKFDCSSEFYRIFDTPEKTVPKAEIFIDKINPEDRQKVVCHWESALKSGVFDLEFRVDVNGIKKWLHGKANIQIEHSTPKYAMGLVQDITILKNLQEAQLRSSQLASLGELAAGVAHEINNPINGIINYADLVLNRPDVEDESKEYVERIIIEGERISDIVKKLLNFAQKDKGGFCLLDISSVVEEPLSLMSQFFKKDGIDFELDITEDLPQVYGNQTQLEQVILNLLTNARHALNKKFDIPNHDKVIYFKASPSIETTGHFLELTVRDAGCGISEESISKIFNPFFTTKEAGVGTGLGLSVCQEILERHNASISIESKEDEFTEVTIKFPVKNQ